MVQKIFDAISYVGRLDNVGCMLVPGLVILLLVIHHLGQALQQSLHVGKFVVHHGGIASTHVWQLAIRLLHAQI